MRSHCDIRHKAADASSILREYSSNEVAVSEVFGGLKTLAEKPEAEKLYARR
jgi:hypothetical protein